MASPRLTRRKALHSASLGLAALSGCAGRAARPSQPTASPTLTSTDAQPTTPSTPAPIHIEGIDVPPCPEIPDEFGKETVLEYAIHFEKSYVIRKTLREQTRGITSIDVTVGDAMEPRAASRVADGWLAQFTVKGPAYRYRTSPDSTEPDHVDPMMYVASYFISEQAVMRAQGGEAVDPREEGSVVYCPPE